MRVLDFVLRYIIMDRVDEINKQMATMGIEDEEYEEMYFGDEAQDVTNKFD